MVDHPSCAECQNLIGFPSYMARGVMNLPNNSYAVTLRKVTLCGTDHVGLVDLMVTEPSQLVSKFGVAIAPIVEVEPGIGRVSDEYLYLDFKESFHRLRRVTNIILENATWVEKINNEFQPSLTAQRVYEYSILPYL